jgi:hypothetical protein
MVTFQDDLPGILGDLSGFMSNPVVKIFAPFYKTPTQVARRITERTPLAIALMPSVREKLIRGSSTERREAMSRIALGSGFGATMMYLGVGGVSDDFVITGYGPRDRKQRASWLENHRPYSIGIRRENGTFEWIGYERYDPISGVLAAAMDTAHILEYSDDIEMNADLVLNLGLLTTQYVGTALPMTQFIGEMVDIAGSPYADSESRIERVTQLLTKQVASAGLIVGQSVATAGLAPQSLTAQFERYLDPISRSTIPDSRYNYIPGMGEISQPMLRGVYEALSYAQSRIPGLSAKLPAARNRWYEPRFQQDPTFLPDGRARGNIFQSFVPFRVQSLPQANIINEELERLGLGFPMLPRSMGEPMINLSGQQYDRYIELYNYPERSEFAKDYFGLDFGGSVPSSAVSGFAVAIQDTDGTYGYNERFDGRSNRPATPKEKMEVLRGVDTSYKKWARELMLLEYPELRALVSQRDTYADYRGRNPDMLFPVQPDELDAAQQINESMIESMRRQ